jgi:phospholipid transport system substrate-binding protein
VSRRLAAVVWLVAAWLFGGTLHGEAGPASEQLRAQIAELHRVVVDTPGDGTLSPDREAAAKKVLDRMFDWTAMARHALGSHWEERTPAERTEFTALFADVFRRAYVSRTHLVDATRFEYLGDSTDGRRGTVRTRLPTKRGSVLGVDYVVGSADGREWRVQDVRVEGVSLIDNYRSQFHTIIATSSYEALVKKLRDRASRG